MNKTIVTSFLILIAAVLPAAAQDPILWDNNIQPNGSGGTALSPPAFPNIRLAEDFVVPKSGWLITQFHVSVVEDANFVRGDRLDVYVYNSNEEGTPGTKRLSVSADFEFKATGDTYFGRREFRYWMDDLDITIPQGKFWVGLRNSDATGSGTNYWISSDGGPDGFDSSRHYKSLDGGKTWIPGVPLRHTQLCFELRGFAGRPAELVRFDVIRGVHLAGGTFALRKSDDDYLIVEARRPSSVSQPSVQVELLASVAPSKPAEIRFDLEAAVLLNGPIQWIDLFNFDSASWERVDEREATTDDSVTTVNIKQNAARFIDTDTGVLRTRVSFYDPGIPGAGWSARFDWMRWLVLAE